MSLSSSTFTREHACCVGVSSVPGGGANSAGGIISSVAMAWQVLSISLSKRFASAEIVPAALCIALTLAPNAVAEFAASPPHSGLSLPSRGSLPFPPRQLASATVVPNITVMAWAFSNTFIQISLGGCARVLGRSHCTGSVPQSEAGRQGCHWPSVRPLTSTCLEKVWMPNRQQIRFGCYAARHV